MSSLEQDAINEWFASKEGVSCADNKTLTLETDQYLRNRLWKAFISGMDAGARIKRERIIAKLDEIFKS